MDEVLNKLAESVPFATTEHLYLWELDKQRRIYAAVIALGCLMVALGIIMKLTPMNAGW
jgi:hypothetical protein